MSDKVTVISKCQFIFCTHWINRVKKRISSLPSKFTFICTKLRCKRVSSSHYKNSSKNENCLQFPQFFFFAYSIIIGSALKWNTIKSLFAVELQESCHEFEQLIIMQCDALMQMIQERRDYLLETIEMDKDHKLRILKVRKIVGLFVVVLNGRNLVFQSSKMYMKF